MAQIFTLPPARPLTSSGGAMPLARLYFYQTATSTPQNTYQDADLSTPHTNPVVADAYGAFAPIFLDPTLPAYRVKLTDSTGAQIWQYDGIPSNQNTAQQFRLISTAPGLLFSETDATSGNKNWGLNVNNETLQLTILNDAESVEVPVLTLSRSGTSVVSMDFAGQYLRIDGVLVATQATSTFTATLSGMTASTTGDITVRRTGSKVALTAVSAITGTSNDTSMTMTGGLFGDLSQSILLPTLVRDNGGNVLGTATVGFNSIVFKATAAGGNFTGSGSKGLPAGWQLIYDTDTSGVA